MLALVNTLNSLAFNVLALLTCRISSMFSSLPHRAKTPSPNVMGKANISVLMCLNELDLTPVRANCCSQTKKAKLFQMHCPLTPLACDIA